MPLPDRKNAPNRLELQPPRIDADNARVFTRTFSRVAGPPGASHALKAGGEGILHLR